MKITGNKGEFWVIRIFLLMTILVGTAFSSIKAQNQVYLDSLQIEIKSTKDDSSRIEILFKISSFYSNHDLLEALNYSREALDLAKEANCKFHQAQAHRRIGTNLTFVGDYDQALNHLLIALRICEEEDYILERLVILTNIGVLNDRLGNFDEAFDYYTQALGLFNEHEKNGHKLEKFSNRVQVLYNNLGNIYETRKDYDAAGQYYLKGLEKAQEHNDLNMLGVIYNNLGKLELAIGNLDKAYEFLQNSIEVRQKADDKIGLTKSYQFLAAYYMQRSDYDSALEFAKLSLNQANEVNALNLSLTAASFLYHIYDKLNNCDKSYEYYRLYKQIDDSLINESTISELTSLKMKYEYEKVEKERIEQENKDKQRNAIIVSALIVISVLVGLLYLLTRSRAQRIILEKKGLEKEIELKNKELTTNVMYLVKKNELINDVTGRILELKKKMKQENQTTIQHIVYDLNSIVDNEVWKEFEFRFQQVHKEFYDNLNTRFPDLTPLERKLSAFLRLNMTTKEITSLTGQSLKSVETARYRLRKKLGISNQEINMVNFLINV